MLLIRTMLSSVLMILVELLEAAALWVKRVGRTGSQNFQQTLKISESETQNSSDSCSFLTEWVPVISMALLNFAKVVFLASNFQIRRFFVSTKFRGRIVTSFISPAMMLLTGIETDRQN